MRALAALALLALLAGCATPPPPQGPPAGLPTIGATNVPQTPAAVEAVDLASLRVDMSRSSEGIIAGTLTLRNPTNVTMRVHDRIAHGWCASDSVLLFNETGAPVFDWGELGPDCAQAPWPEKNIVAVPPGGIVELPFEASGYELPRGKWILVTVDYLPGMVAPGSAPASLVMTAHASQWVKVPA